MNTPKPGDVIKIRVVNLGYVQAAQVTEVYPDGSYDYLVMGSLEFQPLTLGADHVSRDGNRRRVP